MRTLTPNPLVATLLLLVGTSGCAGAEMARSTATGDSVGDGDTGNDGDETSDDPATSDPGTTEPAEDSSDSDTTPGVDESGDTDPTDADETTDPTDASSSEGGSSGDPSETDPTDASSSTTEPVETTDPSESDSETDTQGVDFVDLSGYTVVQTASAREFVIPDNTLVNVGTVIVIGRNASSQSFQDFWGQNWGDDVIYFEGLDDFPNINGDETYSLLDPSLDVVDGPTVPLELATVLARTDASAPGNDDGAWELGLSPNFDSTPGTATAIGVTPGVPYISEFADPTGSGNFDFEFVEIHVPG